MTSINIIEIEKGDILKFDDELYIVNKIENSKIHLELYQMIPERRILKIVEESWILNGKKDMK